MKISDRRSNDPRTVLCQKASKDCNAMSSMQRDELALMFMVRLHCIDGIYKALSSKRLSNQQQLWPIVWAGRILSAGVVARIV